MGLVAEFWGSGQRDAFGSLSTEGRAIRGPSEPKEGWTQNFATRPIFTF